jgi:hypothetical protein
MALDLQKKARAFARRYRPVRGLSRPIRGQPDAPPPAGRCRRRWLLERYEIPLSPPTRRRALESEHDASVEGVGDASQGVEVRAMPATLDPRDLRVTSPDEVGELLLAEALVHPVFDEEPSNLAKAFPLGALGTVLGAAGRSTGRSLISRAADGTGRLVAPQFGSRASARLRAGGCPTGGGSGTGHERELIIFDKRRQVVCAKAHRGRRREAVGEVVGSSAAGSPRTLPWRCRCPLVAAGPSASRWHGGGRTGSPTAGTGSDIGLARSGNEALAVVHRSANCAERVGEGRCSPSG